MNSHHGHGERTHVDVHIDGLEQLLSGIGSGVHAKLDKILENQAAQAGKVEIIMADLTNITAAIRKNTSAVDSAVVLLKDLSDRIIAAKTDPVALQALADEVDAKATVLAQAIVDNTPTA